MYSLINLPQATANKQATQLSQRERAHQQTGSSGHSQECRNHAGTFLCLVTLTVDLLTFLGFPGLKVEHFTFPCQVR